MKHAKKLSLARRKNNTRHLWLVLPVLFGIGLTVFGGEMLWQSYQQTNGIPSLIDGQRITTRSTDQPDETPPKCEDYRVPNNKPRRIILPTIRSEGCIVQVGIDQHGAIAVPSNIHLAGWYTNSVLPGEKGVSIIDGHVSGRYSPGIFKKLKDLKPQDTFKIEYGDTQQKSFRVLSVNSYSVQETTEKMYQQNPSTSNQLNLITCGGAFDAKTQQYEKRILVTASLIAP